MAKAGDLVIINRSVCLLFDNLQGELCNVILVQEDGLDKVAFQGQLRDKDLKIAIESTKALLSLTDLLKKIKINE